VLGIIIYRGQVFVHSDFNGWLLLHHPSYDMLLPFKFHKFSPLRKCHNFPVESAHSFIPRIDVNLFPRRVDADIHVLTYWIMLILIPIVPLSVC